MVKNSQSHLLITLIQDGSLWPICGPELAGDRVISTVKGTQICSLRCMSIFGISLKAELIIFRYHHIHQQTLGALPGSTVVLIDGIVIHSTYSVCRNVYELRSAPVVLL